jgi:Predicted membrane protein (DUF2207)
MRGGRAAAAGTLAVVTVLAPTSTAHAADVGSGHVTDFDVEVEVRPDGVLEVHESITYAFDDRGHGILRSIPYLYRWDETHDREIELGQVSVTSRTAPDDVREEREVVARARPARRVGILVLRIGDPDRVVHGTHTYELDYTVEGALTNRADHVELVWNGIGDEWRTRIDAATITVHAPALQRAGCYHGTVGSDESCGSATRDGVEVEDGGASVAFGPERLTAYEAMTVYAEIPPGSVEVTPPVLVARSFWRRAFSVTPLSVGLAAGLLALGTFAVARLVLPRGRDERARVEASSAGPPVDWRAVRDMRPGPLGTLVDERADVVDVTATIVDLAVRKHLRIEEVGADTFGRRDWRLVRLTGAPDDLLPFENALLDKLFGVGLLGPRWEVRLSELRDAFADSIVALRGSLYEEVVRRGWFRDRPDKIRQQRYVIGGLALALALGIAILLIAFTTLGLVGVALVLPAASLLLATSKRSARTPAGSAARRQAEALRDYLATAVSLPPHPDESDQGFSTMLPYAMVLGLEDRWTRALAPLAAQPHGVAQPAFEPYWYTGPSEGPSLSGSYGFSWAIRSFSSGAGAAMTSRQRSSGYGAGFFGDGGAGFFGYGGGGSSGDGGGGSSGDGGGGGGGDGGGGDGW